MGQAKRRGTYEERKALAVAKLEEKCRAIGAARRTVSKSRIMAAVALAAYAGVAQSILDEDKP